MHFLRWVAIGNTWREMVNTQRLNSLNLSTTLTTTKWSLLIRDRRNRGWISKMTRRYSLANRLGLPPFWLLKWSQLIRRRKRGSSSFHDRCKIREPCQFLRTSCSDMPVSQTTHIRILTQRSSKKEKSEIIRKIQQQTTKVVSKWIQRNQHSRKTSICRN